MLSHFSSDGVTDRPRFVAWLFLASGIWAVALLLILRIGGYGASIFGGLLAGLALAKVRGEAVRRLRDIGARRGIGFALGVVLTVVLAAATLRFMTNGPDLLFGVLLLTAVAAVLVLLMPGHRSESPMTTGNGWLPAMVIVVAFGVIGYAAAAWSDAVQSRRQADADRAGAFVAVPDPLAQNMAGTGQ